MTEEEKIFNSLISQLKANYPLTPASIVVLQLNGFSILEKGDAFKISYCWELESNLYLFSLINSYRLNIIDPAATTLHSRSFKYLCCYLTLTTDLPDTIIRPNTLGEKLATLLTHRHSQIPHNPKFNNKYLLESADAENLIPKLTEELLVHIQDFDELYLEIRDSKCLLLCLRPANYKDTLQLIEISQRLLAL